MKTLYQYSVKVDGQKTLLLEYIGSGKRLNIISCVYDNAENSPLVAAGLLRDLAEWASEQADIIEELDAGVQVLERNPDRGCKAICE